MREAIARQHLAAAQQDAREARQRFLDAGATPEDWQTLEDAEQLASIAAWSADRELKALARDKRKTKLRNWVARQLNR